MLLNCIVCNKAFKTYPSKILLGRGKYCSKGCSYKNFKGKHFSANTEFVKGQPHTFQKHITYTIARKDGRKYKLLHNPEHPHKDHRGYVREHRLVMESYLKRYLLPSEVVHHINGDTLDNSIGNLELLDKKEYDRRNIKLNMHKRWQKLEVSFP